jgi:hypothetical protein
MGENNQTPLPLFDAETIHPLAAGLMGAGLIAALAAVDNNPLSAMLTSMEAESRCEQLRVLLARLEKEDPDACGIVGERLAITVNAAWNWAAEAYDELDAIGEDAPTGQDLLNRMGEDEGALNTIRAALDIGEGTEQVE